MSDTPTAPAPETTEPQPATPAPPATESAAVAAVRQGDFRSLQAATRARQLGRPLADVPAPPPAPAVPEPTEAAAAPTPEATARPTSKRQEKTNDAIREAVDRATADLRAEVARLRSEQPAAPASPQPTEAEHKRYLALPGAPKLADFDTVEEHSAAMALFILNQRDQERTARETVQRQHQEATQTIQTFQHQIADAGGQPFLDALSEDVRGLNPVESVLAHDPKAPVGPLNVLASLIIKSATAPQLLQYLSDHPDDLDAIRRAKDVAEVYQAFGALGAKLDSPSPAAPAKTISSAPPPPTTLSTARPGAPTDVERDAVNRNDFRTFRAQRHQARMAQRA